MALTRILKTDQQTRHIIIVALTAFAMKGDEEKAIAAGCDGYVIKPIDTRNLPLQVGEFLLRGIGGNPPLAKSAPSAQLI